MLLVIVTPQAMTEAKETAAVIASVQKHSGKPVVAVFSGQDSLQEGFELLKSNHVATVLYPEAGAEALASLATVAAWQREQLSTPFTFNDTDKESAEKVIQKARSERRTTLYETEVWEILAAYGFRFLKSQVVHSADEATTAASSFTGTLALKIISPDITHKSDAGGVLLNVSPQDVGKKYQTLMEQVREHAPEAKLEGALLVEMAPGLGKLLMVGLGGIFVETFKDVTFRFAPLTEEDATEMIHELKSLPLLEGARGQEGIDLPTLVSALGRLSLLIQDFPEIEELDINPLLVDSAGAVALDARIRVALSDKSASSMDRLAIRPYPAELEQDITWDEQPLCLRPIRPEDGAAHLAFFDALTPDDVRYRMFVRVRELQPSQLARFTQIDYDREMAFIASRTGANGLPETIGVARVVADPDNVQAEFAVTVRSDLKGHGLGAILMEKLIAYCRARGTREIVGEALPQNTRVIRLARRLGFDITPNPVDETVHMRLPLQ